MGSTEGLSGSSTQPRRNRLGAIVSLGYVLWIIIVVSSCFAVGYLDTIHEIPTPTVEFPTLTPTPLARITSGDISNANKIFEEHFRKTTNDWSDYSGSTIHILRDDTLMLESKYSGWFGAVVCIQCTRLDRPYYFQADLGTDTAKDTTYGILFRSGPFSPKLFYSYTIDAKDKEYFLESYTGDFWSRQTSGMTDLIKPYPDTNTLGIYVNGDYLELYINGKRVDTYQESNTSFQNGTIGFYVNGHNTWVIVRNVSVYAVQ
jgi:hypothetical protein